MPNTWGSLKEGVKEGWDKGIEKNRQKHQDPLQAEDIKRQTLLEAWLSPGYDETYKQLKYEPLPVIDVPLVRLVQLLPGKDWEPIEVFFDNSTLDVEYESLSYCWGDASIRSLIKCNDCRLDVTRNLKSALRDLRRPNTPRILWIDAICINQEDITEREQQIGIMSDIYRNAQRTVVWLGEAFVGNESAFKMLKRIHDLYDDMLRDGSFSGVVWQEGGGAQLGDPATNPTEKELTALYTLLRRPWFYRMWVVQEISLAKEVVITCGDQEMDWDEFHGGALATYFLGWGSTESQTTSFASLFELDSARTAVIQEKSEDLELVPLLNDFRRFFCSDPRDKIVALFGLTSTELDKMHLVADYHCEPEDFYINAAQSILKSSVTLDLLSSPRGSSKLPLPSWVPDWSDSSPKRHSFFTREGDPRDEFPPIPFNASGPSTSPVPIFGPANSLTLLGHRIAIISTLTPALPDTRFDSDILKRKAGAVSSYGKGLRDLFKWAYNIVEDVAAQRDTFVVWDNTVLGPKLEKANTPYVSTSETYEMAYVRILCGDNMPHGPEAALKSFRKVGVPPCR